MTQKSLIVWRAERAWTKARAARELGLGRNTYAAYEARDAAPLAVALACAAIAYGLPPIVTVEGE